MLPRNIGSHLRGLPGFSSDFLLRAYVGVKVLFFSGESKSVSLGEIARVTAKSRRVVMEAM